VALKNPLVFERTEKGNTNPFLLEFELNNVYYKKVNGNISSIILNIAIFLTFINSF